MTLMGKWILTLWKAFTICEVETHFFFLYITSLAGFVSLLTRFFLLSARSAQCPAGRAESYQNFLLLSFFGAHSPNFINHLEIYFVGSHPINSQFYASGVDMLNGSLFESAIVLGKSKE